MQNGFIVSICLENIIKSHLLAKEQRRSLPQTGIAVVLVFYNVNYKTYPRESACILIYLIDLNNNNQSLF